jgi:beta-D-galactosyl-(1->4)-L-rhamnose phosphorylase
MLTRWVQQGGGLIGIGEPGALAQPGRYFQLAQTLGVDRDRGERLANGKYRYAVPAAKAKRRAVADHFITADLTGAPDFGDDVRGIFVLGGGTHVLADHAAERSPMLATHDFGRGRSVYLSGFTCTHENTRMLHRALFWAASRENEWGAWQTANVKTEASYFPRAGKLVVINNAGTPEATTVTLGDGTNLKRMRLPPHGIAVADVQPSNARPNPRAISPIL